MAARIDLNCDLGEELDAWEPGVDGLDAQLLDVVTSANVACGFHAGDARIMAAVCRAAAVRGVAIGAHVSYLDREHFGRRFLDVPPDVLRAQVAYQVARCRRSRARVGAHGRLREAARRAVQRGRPPRGAGAGGRRGGRRPAGGRAARVRRARARGGEGAADGHGGVRRPRLPGRRDARAALASRVRWSRTRTQVAARVRADRRRGAGDARSTAPTCACAAESVCVHSDTPGAVVLARPVRARAGGVGRRRPALRDAVSGASGDDRRTTTRAVLPFGDDAVLVELADLAAVRALDDAIRAARDESDPDAATIVDQVPGGPHAAAAGARRRGPARARRVPSRCVGGRGPSARGRRRDRRGRRPRGRLRRPGPRRRRRADRAHASTRSSPGTRPRTYTVAFGGFMPGFAYLTGLDPALRVPRLDVAARAGPGGVGGDRRRVQRGLPGGDPGRLAAARPVRRAAVRRRPRPAGAAAAGHARAVRRRR